MSRDAQVPDGVRRFRNRIVTEQVWRKVDDRLISELSSRERDELAEEYGKRFATLIPTALLAGLDRKDADEITRIIARAHGRRIMRRKLAERPHFAMETP